MLVIEGQPGGAQNIVAALKATQIDVTLGTPIDVPITLEGLAGYTAVVLADVPAVDLGPTRMLVLQAYVRDLGRGLVVSGGENSYGVGGYASTPLEETLPVKMDIPQHKETPSIAVVLIIESLEADYSVNTEPRPHLIHQEQCRDLLDPLLDGGQADELAVEGLQQLVDAGRLPLGGEIDAGVVGQQICPAPLLFAQDQILLNGAPALRPGHWPPGGAGAAIPNPGLLRGASVMTRTGHPSACRAHTDES